MTTQTDEALINAYVAAGDEAAFAALVRRHGGLVYRVCRGLLGNHADAQDAAQAAFVILARKAGTLRRRADVSSWLYGVARNTARETLRQRASRSNWEQEAAAMTDETSQQELDEETRARAMGAIYEELANLSERQRQAVLLRYIEGLSQEAAAAAAGCQVGTLGWRASAGLAELRKRLTRRGLALSAPALGGLLAVESQAAVPASAWTAMLGAKSLAAGMAAGAGGNAAITLAEATMKAMLMAKIKVAAAVAAVALGTAGVSAPLVIKAVGATVPQAMQKDSKANQKPVPTGETIPAPVTNKAGVEINTPAATPAIFTQTWAHPLKGLGSTLVASENQVFWVEKEHWRSPTTTLFCADAKSGTELWKIPLKPAHTLTKLRLLGNRLMVGLNSDKGQGEITGFDTATGNPLWNRKVGGYLNDMERQPVLTPEDIGQQSTRHILDPDTGADKFTISVTGSCYCPLVLAGNYLIAGGYEEIQALDNFRLPAKTLIQSKNRFFS